MEILKDYFNHIENVTPGFDHVNKSECMYSFDTPETPGGLYICMKTFQAVGPAFVEYFFNRYNHAVYLHHQRVRYELPKQESPNAETRPKRLAIGVEDGFNPHNKTAYRHEDTYSIVIYNDGFREPIVIPLPSKDLPEHVLKSVESIINEPNTDVTLLSKETNVWDGEFLKESKYAADLQQCDSENAPQVPPARWKCDKCDLKENLWLNLSDGSILCGRKFYDGSGGNNHASEHYDKFKYPLAVKLGTITRNGADVYSYAEEDMVIDPYLDKHLAHFGIDIQNMKKTEKSMIELEIDMNEKLGEWSVIQEEGKELVPVAGPGFTGIINLGNSCYMNTVIQVLFSLGEFDQHYYPPVYVYNRCDSHTEFEFQMAKLSYGILSGRYSEIQGKDLKSGIAPKTFKYHVCGDHPDFSTKRQQDAHEFFLFLLDKIESDDQRLKNTYADPDKKKPPSDVFKIIIEDRLECDASKKVKYTQKMEYCLNLQVDLAYAVNSDELAVYDLQVGNLDSEAKKNVVKPKPIIPIWSCLENFLKPETIEDFTSPVTKAKTTAMKISRIKRFPRVISFQMKKFQLGPDWIPTKMDVAFEVPEFIDLEPFISKGKLPTESLMEPEEEIQASSSSQVAQSSRHNQDAQPAGQNIEPDNEAVALLVSMGIDPTHAITALKACKNDTQKAVEYIFDPLQYLADSASTVAAADAHTALTMDEADDEKPKLYQLKAFISHMGTSTMNGHYVCHIKKDEKWYIFNDEKVAISENPPKQFGYLYFYERMYC